MVVEEGGDRLYIPKLVAAHLLLLVDLMAHLLVELDRELLLGHSENQMGHSIPAEAEVELVHFLEVLEGLEEVGMEEDLVQVDLMEKQILVEAVVAADPGQMAQVVLV